MADVVVNIRGNTIGLQNDLSQIGNQMSSNIPMSASQTYPQMGSQQTLMTQNTANGAPAMPTYDRLAQDIRREILNRGVLMVPGSTNFTQFMNTIQQQQRSTRYRDIDTKYDYLFDKLQEERREEEDSVRQDIELKRQRALSNTDDPFRIKSINNNFDSVLSKKLSAIDKKYSPLYEQLETESAKEREKVDSDLTKAISDLTDELKRGNPNSYLGQLRGQYREAIWKRDNAETEEEARAASREAANIEQRMAKTIGRQNPLQRIGAGWSSAATILGVGVQGYNDYLANTGRKIDVLGTAANGDIFASMEQDFQRRKAAAAKLGAGIGGTIGTFVGGAAAGAGSWGIGTVGGAAAGAGIGSGFGAWALSAVFQAMHASEENQIKLGSLWAQQEKRLQEFTQLALMTKGTSMWVGDNSNDLDSVRNSLLMSLGSDDYFTGAGGINIYDLGYSSDQASKMIAQRLSQRGFINDNPARRALNADALEKAFNMSNGSLGQLSAYDRYGNDANQDFTNLVVSLSGLTSLDGKKTLGMSNGQTLRANEFMSYQQQLLESQKSWMLNPNSNFATRQLLAAQSVYGNSLDSRGIQAIGRMNEAITRPAEGMSKVLTYDVIQDLFPETRGNLLAIRQKQFSNKTEDRALIQKAMFEKLTSIYGGADTTSGYLALSQYTGIDNPYELDKWVTRMKKGLPGVTEGSIEAKISPMKNYTQEISKQMLKYTDDTMKEISKELSALNTIADKMLTTFKSSLQEIVNELSR